MESLDPTPDLSVTEAVSSGDALTGREEAATGAQEEPNPFWSERASDEFRLQRARPLQLAEFDDRQLEPGYESDTGHSGGFVSVAAPSVRIASPNFARGSETSSEARRSVTASNAPSGASRSRSPMRSELPGVRELLVSLGNAVAGLAEEQRNTQRRLSVVEEIRSGSSSSMRTGREGVEVEVGQVGVGYGGMGTQFFQISDEDLGENRNLRSGMLNLEDWVQAPLRLEDVPRDSRPFGPTGAPESYGPVSAEATSSNTVSAQAGARQQMFDSGRSALEPGIAGAISAQAGSGRSALEPCIAGAISAQVGSGRSAFEPGIAGAISAQVGSGRSAFEPGIAGAISAQAGSGRSALGPGIAGAISAQAGSGCSAFGAGIAGAISAQAGSGCSAHDPVIARGVQTHVGTYPVGNVEGVVPSGCGQFADSAQVGARWSGDVGRCGQAQDTMWAMTSGTHEADDKGQPGHGFTVWVDGVPRVAVFGPRGIEVGGQLNGERGGPFQGNVGHPFVSVESGCDRTAWSPPPPPPPGDGPLRFSPMTPNGTRVPKGPPPADSMVWPDWSKPMGEIGPVFDNVIPPPSLPPELQRPEGSQGQARPEEPSRSVTDLPELQAFTPQEGSVLAGDWITQLSPVIGTMSATSSVWWGEVLREAYRLYTKWLAADPVQRLSIKAEATCSLSPSPRHVLIEQRLTVLLMRAVPAEIRAELVAVRAMSSLAVVVAVLCRYQPGGPNERANVLAFLVAPDRPTSIEVGIATCRRWLRQLQRAKELGLMLPDATLLIKGADALLGPVLTKSQQASFRLNSFRNERKLDYAPAFDSIVAFGQLILAEYELLQHSEPGEPRKPKINKAVEGEDEQPPKGGKGKQQKGDSPLDSKGHRGGSNPIPSPQGSGSKESGKGSGRVPCKYWCVTDLGCTRAARCPDVHNKELLKGTSRCWVCSSTQHQKQECPRLPKEGGDEPPSKGKGGKGKPEPKVKAAKEEEAQPVLAPSAQQLIQDTAALLKNLRISKVGEHVGSSRALLDSGATACMRTARPGELEGLPERTVHLAPGEVRLRVNEGGALLTSANVDPIVSLHKLCQVGYRGDWSRDGGCRVSAPGRTALRVYMDGGCPEVDRHVGLALIQEIEAFQVRNANALRSLRSWEEKGEPQTTLTEALKALPVDPSLAMQWLSAKFPSLPGEILARIPVASCYDATRVAWNRRQRRTWSRSKALALHLFSGPQKKFWELSRQDAHCVCVDIQENLLDDHTYAFLQDMALQGRLCAVFGGPPCRTFSLSRYMPPDLPRPLRGRTKDTQWGFDYLTPSERELVLTDGILMFRMVWLYLIAEAMAARLNLPKPFFGVEQPQDPETWARPQDLGFRAPADGLASCWALDAIKDFAREHELYFWHLDQGPLGHERRKPATILSSVPAPPDVLVAGPGHGTHSDASATGAVSGPWPSAAWAMWAPGLKVILKREVMSAVDSWTSEKCKALREQENFLRHVVQGHVDFRRDCAACLAGAARGARHNRQSVHDAWVLHVDLMGPFAEGADEHGKVKYVLTGILTVPDFSRVADAVRESEDVASGSAKASLSSTEVPGLPLEVHDRFPVSSLGPPPSLPLSPVLENEFEGYEPSEPSEADAYEDLMALQPDEDVEPETAPETAAVDRANQRWRDAALALQLQDCPVLELPLLRMLPNKSQQSVAQGLTAMLAQLKYEGFMVRRLRSDRGREFNNGVVQRLCRQRDVFQTFTQGDDPQQNGRVENYHARLNGKTRTLLRSVSGDVTDWPYAMRTAQAAMWAQAVGKLGRPGWQPLPFGTQVRVRTRSWERSGDVWSDRVQDALVLAPSVETCKGHVVRTAGGTLLHTTALFRGAVQCPPRPVVPPELVLPAQARAAPVPVSAPVEPEISVYFPHADAVSAPHRRVTGKQPPASLKAVHTPVACRAEADALSAAAAALLSLRPVPFRTSAALLVSAPVLRDLARALPARLGAGESSTYLMFGWFKHGGLTGLSSITHQLPGVVQLLNALLAQAHPSGTWTTLGLFFAAVAGPHVDRRNVQSTYNYVLPLALPPTEQYMWVQNSLGRPLQPLSYLDDRGSARPGFRLPLHVGQPACVDPHSLHALPAPLPHESAHNHVLLVGFTVPWLHRATDEQRHTLQSLGFRLGLSRGGVSPGVSAKSPGVSAKVFAAVEQGEDCDPGLLESCLTSEGHPLLEHERELL